MTDFFTLDPTWRDLAPDVIDEDGRPRLMPAPYYAGTTKEERALLGHRHALYLLPTEELVDWLVGHIAGRDAIEIGSGNGRLAQRLGIRATDSMLQNKPEGREIYDITGQPRITYGANVEELEAKAAVRKYHPQVVVGAWITHRYNRRQHSRGGNQYGPDIDWILERVDEYVLIGNEQTHAKNPLWQRPHEIQYLPFVYSRSMNGSREFVAVWKGRGRR